MVHDPDAGHSMAKATLEGSGIAPWILALWQPREIFVDGVLATIRSFADQQSAR